ncbi:MAG: PACE efflux transporter [Micrococcaceae bacterium]
MTLSQDSGVPGSPVSPRPDVPLGPGGRPALVGRRIFPSPGSRRLVYAVVFEALAIAFTTTLLVAIGQSAQGSLLVGVVSSAVALTWNLVFNTIFEAWERRSGHTGRPWWVRVLHALCFEAGLMIILIPLIAWILDITLLQALVLEAGLLLFFLIYTAVYAWSFDRVFGLPDAAQTVPPSG